MSTKDDKDSFIKQYFTNSEKKYYNLNVNQDNKCPNLIPVKTESKSDDYEEKGKFKSSSQSSKTSNFSPDNEVDNDLKKEWKNENIFNNPTKSLVSLRISAFENLNEPVGADLFDDKNNDGLKKEKVKSIKECITDNFKLQNPFEFKRQSNEEIMGSEVDDYHASQRLQNPNQASRISQQAGNIDAQIPPDANVADNNLSLADYAQYVQEEVLREREDEEEFVEESDEESSDDEFLYSNPRSQIRSKRKRMKERHNREQIQLEFSDVSDDDDDELYVDASNDVAIQVDDEVHQDVPEHTSNAEDDNMQIVDEDNPGDSGNGDAGNDEPISEVQKLYNMIRDSPTDYFYDMVFLHYSYDLPWSKNGSNNLKGRARNDIFQALTLKYKNKMTATAFKDKFNKFVKDARNKKSEQIIYGKEGVHYTTAELLVLEKNRKFT